MEKIIDGLVFSTEKSELIYQDPDDGTSYYKSPTGILFRYNQKDIKIISEEELYGILNYDGQVGVIRKFFFDRIQGEA